MAEYRVIVEGTIVEYYDVEADSPDEAKARVQDGWFVTPSQSEVIDCEVVDVTVT
jgi:hypothetical protein